VRLIDDTRTVAARWLPGAAHLAAAFPKGEVARMISPIVGQVTLAIYAVLLAVGGVIGYLKAGSKPSLIAGLISAAAALAALGLSITSGPWGVALGLLLAIVLFLFFGYRYAARTRKFMPSGLLAVLSLVVLAVMFLVMDWSWRAPPGG
jgi:uncharacterized membrane protein (UPF0136 family)